MTQEIEDIDVGADPLGLTEPDNLFPDVLDAEPTVVAKAARDLVKIDLRAAALARFGDWRAGAQAVLARVKGKAYDNIQTPAGLKEATADRAALRDPRLKAQKVAEAVKKQLRSVAGDVGAELETIVDTLKPEEERIAAIIAAENERREEATRQKAAAEAARQRAHEENIDKIRAFATTHAQGRDVDGLQRLIDTLNGIPVDESWQEYADQARSAIANTVMELQNRQHEITRAEAEAAEQARAAEATREREEQLRVQAEALAQQKAQIEKQQDAMTRMGQWAALPTQMPGPGSFAAAQLEEAASALAGENPDAPTFGAMLPVALIAHSTALAHMRGLVDLARRRDFAARNLAADQQQIDEARAFGPPDADGTQVEDAKVAAPALEPSTGHVTASRSGTTTTTWAEVGAGAARHLPVPGFDNAPARVLYGDEPIGEQSHTPMPAAATTSAVDAAAMLAEKANKPWTDPATAVLNMGAMNERFGFTLTRAYVENKLNVLARREDRRAAFWTEDDYLLIAARIGEQMDAIVAKGMGTE